MDLIVGAGQLDRTLQDIEALVDSYRTDDGLRYLDYQPLTPPDRMVPEDLAVTILINSRVAGTAFKAVQDHGHEIPLGALPDCALEDSDDGDRQAVCDVICTVIAWPFAASVATKVPPQEAAGAHPDPRQRGDLWCLHEPDLAGAASLDGQRLLPQSDPRGARLDLGRPHLSREPRRVGRRSPGRTRYAPASSCSTWPGGCTFLGAACRTPDLATEMTGPVEASASDQGHRVTEDWMGAPVETLADLLRPGLRAVCVGINPALVSVRAGHYYQGRLGQAFFARLRRAGLLPTDARGCEDDIAFANGIGFTDIVKRPTRREADVRAEEYEYGRLLLASKLEEARAGLVIFSFKKAAERYFRPFRGNGFVAELRIGDADVFVMPGPYERNETVELRLSELAGRVLEA